MINIQSLEKAFALLDTLLLREPGDPLHLLVGGGSAIVGVYHYPGSTVDVDAGLDQSIL